MYVHVHVPRTIRVLDLLGGSDVPRTSQSAVIPRTSQSARDWFLRRIRKKSMSSASCAPGEEVGVGVGTGIGVRVGAGSGRSWGTGSGSRVS